MARADHRNRRASGPLGWVERVGNALPDPAFLFLFATLLVFVASWIAVASGWEVAKFVASGAGEALRFEPSGELLGARNLCSADGLWWLLSTMEDNFVSFAPLKAILVGMLGVGLAEKSGLIRACLRAGASRLPRAALAPMLIFLGVMSSAGLDAGYIVLPPLAVALYRAYGLAPQVGVAAVFAGVSAGFCANLLPTSLDPLLAEFTAEGAQVLLAGYEVNPLCNWFFAAASTVMLPFVGWWVTEQVVAPRFVAPNAGRAGTGDGDSQDGQLPPLTSAERAGLWAALAVALLVMAGFVLMTLRPGWPLHGMPAEGGLPRYAHAIVPFIAALFGFAGIAHGTVAGTMRDGAAIAAGLVESMRVMAPIIVLAFFAAQFVESFKISGLAEMTAFTGGAALIEAELPPLLLLGLFVLLAMGLNLLMGSMSAKYAILAPVIVPMFVLVGISPELTQAAYRVGDSTTNILTPLNAYFVVVLAAMRQADPKAGIGTLMAAMVPYSFWFTLAWAVLLGLWVAFGLPLGLDGELWVGGD